MKNVKDINSIKELVELKLQTENKRNQAKTDNEDMAVEWYNSDLNSIDERMEELK